MAWLTNWYRRKQLYLNGTTAGNQSSYQMKFTVYQASGTDTSSNIYLGGNVKTDFSDLRFTDSGGSTTLNYWIETITGTSPNQIATVLVKIPSIPTGSNSTSIYIYYNNPSASAASSGPGTFISYTDFEDGTLQGWSTYVRSGSPTPVAVSTDWSAGGGSYSAKFIGQPSNKNPGILKSMSSTNVRVVLDWNVTQSNNCISTNCPFLYLDGPITAVISGNNGTGTWESPTITTATPYNLMLSTANTGTSTVIGYMDRIRVRNYASPEPTWGSVSSEEGVGNVSVDSNPSVARIWIDGIDQSVYTPYTLYGLTSGTHSYRLVLTGYADATGTFPITTSQTYNLLVTFAGSAYFTSSPSGASVYLDGSGTSSGTTPVTITNLTAQSSGSTLGHTYRLANTGCPDATGSFTAIAGSTVNVSITFAGYLSISSTPTGARIWLAHPTGTTYVDQGINTNNTLTVVTGSYDVKLVLTGYQDWISTNYSVNSCQTTNVPATLTVACGSPSCNLIIMSMVEERLLKNPPGYLDLNELSIYIDNIIGRYILHGIYTYYTRDTEN